MKLFKSFSDAYQYALTKPYGKVKMRWFHRVQKWAVWLVSMAVVAYVLF